MNAKATQQAMDAAVEHIEQLPPDQRNQWISYFLESLDAKFGEAKIRTIQSMIEERLKNGRW